LLKTKKNKSDNEEVKNTKEEKQEHQGKNKNNQDFYDEHNDKNNDIEDNNNHNNKGCTNESKENDDDIDDTNGKEKGDEEEQEENYDDNMDEDKYCLNLHNSGHRQHTSKWKSIPEGVMNNSVKLTLADEDSIMGSLQDIAEEMSTSLAKMDKDKWIKIFNKTKDILAARNNKRFVPIFRVSLARSNPHELFRQDVFNSNKLLETKITMAWAAAYTIYGPGWPKDTIDLRNSISPTNLFATCSKEDFFSRVRYTQNAQKP
jgi:hypothetical protein